MLILSWNVAGLSTTLKRVHENYNSKKSPSKSLHLYFEKHCADIVCLQEHKIPKQQLSNRAFAAAEMDGYESFWSCCTDEASKGMNGVVTYCRKGMVRSAQSNPLGDPSLDRQGRCVMTDHGNFAIFNVYVPNASRELSGRMKFLQALECAMKNVRATKPVILVGDMNIALSSMDVHWKDRLVNMEDVLSCVSESSPTWKLDVQKHWSTKIRAAMTTREAVSTTTTNPTTGEKFQKFRLAVTVDNRRIFLGHHETTPEYCSYAYNFVPIPTEDQNSDDCSSHDDSVRVGVLTEIMDKIAGVTWDEEIQRQVAMEGDTEVRAPPRQWFRALIADGMVDAFRHFHPKAEARFTCWNQNKNRRYYNDGARIDYTLVDQRLMGDVLQGEFKYDYGEEAALDAATASGRFQPVSFQGGGMTESTQDALDSQFCQPHTGHVYTPPTFSDHIGVSVLLRDTVLSSRDQSVDTKDAATRKAQPHKQQTSISSFFKAGSSGKAAGKSTAVTLPTTHNPKRHKTSKVPPKHSVLHHFRKDL